MPKREVVFTRLSGLFAFGVGVAVGANWPRASNFVGFILQRLGFELTDLALWMWDPEESAVRTPETSPVRRPKAKKRTRALRIKAGNPTNTNGRSEAKKTAPSGIQSSAAITRGARKKGANSHEPWSRPDRIESPAARTNSRYLNSQLIQSGHTGIRAARRKSTIAHARSVQPGKSAPLTGRKKPTALNTSLTQPDNTAIRDLRTKLKSELVKNKRKTQTARTGGKSSTFDSTVLPAAAGLN